MEKAEHVIYALLAERAALLAERDTLVAERAVLRAEQHALLMECVMMTQVYNVACTNEAAAILISVNDPTPENGTILEKMTMERQTTEECLKHIHEDLGMYAREMISESIERTCDKLEYIEWQIPTLLRGQLTSHYGGFF